MRKRIQLWRWFTWKVISTTNHNQSIKSQKCNVKSNDSLDPRICDATHDTYYEKASKSEISSLLAWNQSLLCAYSVSEFDDKTNSTRLVYIDWFRTSWSHIYHSLTLKNVVYLDHDDDNVFALMIFHLSIVHLFLRLMILKRLNCLLNDVNTSFVRCFHLLTHSHQKDVLELESTARDHLSESSAFLNSLQTLNFIQRCCCLI